MAGEDRRKMGNKCGVLLFFGALGLGKVLKIILKIKTGQQGGCRERETRLDRALPLSFTHFSLK